VKGRQEGKLRQSVKKLSKQSDGLKRRLNEEGTKRNLPLSSENLKRGRKLRLKERRSPRKDF